VRAIFASYEDRAAQQRRRGYLGGSELGRECARELWYRFRWALRTSFEGRMLRLFETGNREEERLIDELKRIGIEVHEQDGETGKQWRFSALGGHLSGGIDGVALGFLEAPKTWHLCEFKTANTKSFTRTKKNGVEKAQPVHFAQMQLYMGLARLSRAAYFVVCKDTDEIYFERVSFAKGVFARLMEKAQQIVESPEPLTKASLDPESHFCRYCDMKPVCHEETLPEVNCRTCAHSTPVLDDSDTATWMCSLTGEMLPLQTQERGCEEHLFIPSLVSYAEPIDGDESYVLYQLKKKPEQRFANVASAGFPALDVPHFSSASLRAVPPAAIGHEGVEAVREVLGVLR
jgi:hypothetical protein